MKKLNLLALVILVSVNVFTPLSYAQEEVPVEGETLYEQTDAPDTEVSDEQIASPSQDVVEPTDVEESTAEELVEDLPEVLQDTPSLIDIIVDVVNDFAEATPQESELAGAEESTQEFLPQEDQLSDNTLLKSDDSELEELREIQEVNPDITMTYADNVVTYVDAHWNEFEMWTITITDTTTSKSITMLDRNLWATDTKWEDAYWYHFQWWNNYGFDRRLDNEPHEAKKVDASDYWYNHPYSNGVFLKQIPLADNWDSSNNPNLWWDDIDEDYARQWPCPVWYHVPTIEEWSNVLKMYHDMNPKWSTIEWWNSEPDDWDLWVDAAYIWDPITYRVDNLAFRKAFQDAFYIPLAWFRNNDYKLENQWEEARFWSSTPSADNETKSRRFFVGNSVVDSINAKERVYGYSVRCFQNTADTDTVTLSFDTRWWNTIQSVLWLKWEDWFEPSTPTKQWDKFLGWYLDADMTSLYDNSSAINSDTTFYAKWRSDAVIYEDLATTYTDTLGNVFDMWSITITNWTDTITILDRNLWATDIKWEEAYWYHFQWWNNYGFPWYDEITLTDEAVDASEYNRHSPYVRDTFVLWEYWDESENDDLWWDVVDEDYARQWPCPEGYHVPNLDEWENLINLYSDVWWFTPIVATVGGLETSEVTAYGLDPMIFREEFQDVFRIPLANRRNYSDGQVQQLWSDARIWASTANPDGIKAGRFYLWWTTVDAKDKYNQRGYWYSVRCFKNADDSDNIVLTYEVNWGTAIQAQTLPKWATWYLPWYTTSKDGDELLGWYSDDKMTTPFDFNTPLTNDTTIYAKWALSYVVTFKDWNWTVLKREVVHQWESATAPANPSRDGYTFKWWDKPVNNITQDVDITAVYEKNDTGWHSSWWGGWGIHKPDSKWDGPNTETKDTPATDDSKPEDEHKSAPEKTEPTSTRGNWDPVPPEENTEMRSAYTFSYSKWITTQPTYEEARVDKKLTRIEMAKMLSQYAINVMGSEPDITRYNKFADVSDKLDSDYNDAVTLAYELWIMWINMPNNEFRPKDYVTRWEFATALSRMVYGTSDGKYRQTSKYYTMHIQKLESEKVLTQVDPAMMERRWYVMIMLMRLASMF